MAQRPQVKINVKQSNYAAVAALGQQIHDQMLANAADFPVPIPSMATLQTQVTALVAAIANWGPVGNRGSHAQLVALRSATNVVYTSLILLAAFVQNLVDPSLSYPDQTAFILSSGLSVKNAPTPQGVLNAPEGLIQMISPSVPLSTPKLKWTKPVDLLSPNNVKAYRVSRANVGFGQPILVIGYPTKTSFIDESAEGDHQYQYTVAAINSAGIGVESAPIIVSVPL